jgi:hypothetical protein
MPENDEASADAAADKAYKTLKVSGSWCCNLYTLKFYAYLRNTEST